MESGIKTTLMDYVGFDVLVANSCKQTRIAHILSALSKSNEFIYFFCRFAGRLFLLLTVYRFSAILLFGRHLITLKAIKETSRIKQK